MPILDANREYDGFFSQEGGVDAGRRPHLIAKNQSERADNCIFRSGDTTNRPPIQERPITFENPFTSYLSTGAFDSEEGDGTSRQSETQFLIGLFQGAYYYKAAPGKEYLMVSIAGRLWRITPGLTDASAREIPIKPFRNRAAIPINYHVQADTYFIVQDGEALPIIFDGIVARRATKDEIFTGTIMAYGMNRIILKGVDGQVYFGDIRDGKGNGGKDVLGFTETTFLNEGFPSAIPAQMGEVTAMKFIPQQDTSTGVGELLVFGESGVEAFYLSIPRETWKDSVFQRDALIEKGATGHLQTAAANQDVFFRSDDGYRSYRQARAEVNKWSQIPLSTNVKTWVNNDTPWMLNRGSMIEFNNRLLMTCSPQPNQGKPYHHGLLALDFDVLSSFGESSAPAWDGHWVDANLDALKITQLVSGKFNGVQRAFAFVLDRNNHNALVEIMRDPSGVDMNGKITSVLTMRSFDFESPDNEKILYGADVWPDGVSESVDFTLEYRPDQIPDFQPWDTFKVLPQGTPQAITPGGVPTADVGYDPRHKIKKPDESADRITGRMFRRGYEIQPRLTWKGRARVRRFRLQAVKEVEDKGGTK